MSGPVKKLLTVVMTALVVMAAGCSDPYGRPDDLVALYEDVDREIASSRQYMEQREQRIRQLQMNLASAATPGHRLALLLDLTREYASYNSDSALYYSTEAEHLARRLGDSAEVNLCLIAKADIASHAGLFSEAHEILAGIDRRALNARTLARLYGVYCALYQYETEYMPDGEFSARAIQLRDAYTDSLMLATPKESFAYLINVANRDIMEGRAASVVPDLEKNLLKFRSGDRPYSILTSILANAYKSLGDTLNYKKYLAITVISDIRGATKENMAMRDLATQVFEEGDIARANHYVKVSLDDANFYVSRLRNAQSGRILPVIDKAYDRQQKKLQTRLRVYLYALAALLIIVIAAVAYIVRQWRSVEEANRRVSQTNDELQSMSARLLDANSALERSNSALEHSNAELKRSARIMEEYTGLFMEYSSLVISSLEKYHSVLRNLALQGNVKGILKKLDSDEIVNENIKAFYSKFDEAVLTMYPSFVERVNSLLRDDGKVVLRPGEKLNTELRVLAVMHLGISDPEKIAGFLRCSVATVYTYRSRLKKRAADPATFESRILSI